MDAPFKTIGEVNAYEENEVVKIQARGLPEATQKKRIRDRDRDRVGIRATALRDRDRASIEVGASTQRVLYWFRYHYSVSDR